MGRSLPDTRVMVYEALSKRSTAATSRRGNSSHKGVTRSHTDVVSTNVRLNNQHVNVMSEGKPDRWIVRAICLVGFMVSLYLVSNADSRFSRGTAKAELGVAWELGYLLSVQTSSNLIQHHPNYHRRTPEQRTTAKFPLFGGFTYCFNILNVFGHV